MLALVLLELGCSSAMQPPPSVPPPPTREPPARMDSSKRLPAIGTFDDPACEGIDRSIRTECPFLGHLVAVRDLPHGVRLLVLEGESIDMAFAHMRCHLAYARVTGRWDERGCPLLLRGMEVRMSADGTAMEVTSEDPATASEIRRRFRSRIVL